MATRDEVARQPLEQRRARLALTPDELAEEIHGQPEAVLARRPEATSWAAKEIVCHAGCAHSGQNLAVADSCRPQCWHRGHLI